MLFRYHQIFEADTYGTNCPLPRWSVDHLFSNGAFCMK